jgi:hypothetical protein
MRTQTLLFLYFLLCISNVGSAYVQKRKPTPAIPERITVYYLPFTTETFSSYTPEMLKKSKQKRVVTDEHLIELLYRDLHRYRKKGHFDKTLSRLLIVDREGGVLDGRQQYTLTPRQFVGVATVLQMIFSNDEKDQGQSNVKSH